MPIKSDTTSTVLEEGLWALRYGHASGILWIVLMYVFIKVTGISDWKTGPAFIVGTLIGTAGSVMFKEKKAIYIYGYQLENEVLELLLVNIFGKKESILLPVSQIEKVKYRKRNYWNRWDHIWIHSDVEVRQLYFFKKGMGHGLIQQLQVEKL
jgi:hypothetical protein